MDSRRSILIWRHLSGSLSAYSKYIDANENIEHEIRTHFNRQLRLIFCFFFLSARFRLVHTCLHIERSTHNKETKLIAILTYRMIWDISNKPIRRDSVNTIQFTISKKKTKNNLLSNKFAFCRNDLIVACARSLSSAKSQKNIERVRERGKMLEFRLFARIIYRSIGQCNRKEWTDLTRVCGIEID